jgi:hypothetical protein
LSLSVTRSLYKVFHVPNPFDLLTAMARATRSSKNKDTKAVAAKKKATTTKANNNKRSAKTTVAESPLLQSLAVDPSAVAVAKHQDPLDGGANDVVVDAPSNDTKAASRRQRRAPRGRTVVARSYKDDSTDDSSGKGTSDTGGMSQEESDGDSSVEAPSKNTRVNNKATTGRTKTMPRKTAAAAASKKKTETTSTKTKACHQHVTLHCMFARRSLQNQIQSRDNKQMLI